MKSLYSILVHLSLEKPLGRPNSEDCPNFLEPKARSSVAELLFEELDRRFEFFFSALCDVSENRGNGHVVLGSDVWAKVDGMTLLLRCCMVILTMVDQDLVLKKFQVLVLIIGKLKSLMTIRGNEKSQVTFEKVLSREFSFNDATSATSITEDFIASISIVEPSDPCLPSLCAILEVYFGIIISIIFSGITFSFPISFNDFCLENKFVVTCKEEMILLCFLLVLELDSEEGKV